MHLDQTSDARTNPLRALRRFVQPRPKVERCELCSLELATEHPHLLELENRRVLCVCQACAVLFSDASQPRYRRVPQRIEFLQDFRLSDARWDRLQVPINLLFFAYHAAAGRVVAQYPSPAGPMESLLDLEAWEDLAADNPVLRELQPDVEALLVNRTDSTREYYRVPIDECFKLVGLVRVHWKGFMGGDEVREQMATFFAELKRRAL